MPMHSNFYFPKYIHGKLNPFSRPVMNVTDAVTVKFKLKLSQLIDVVRGFTLFELVHLQCITLLLL